MEDLPASVVDELGLLHLLELLLLLHVLLVDPVLLTRQEGLLVLGELSR